MASRGPLLLGALWLTAAAAATSVGLLAVHLVGTEVGAQVAAPLDQQGVQQALGSVSPAPAGSEQPEAEQPAEQASQGRARTVVTDGGVVSARCTNGRPRLLYATPADGYRTERGPQTVTFVGTRTRVVLALGCAGSELRTTTTTQRTGTRPAPSPAPVVQPSPTRAPEPTDAPSDGPEVEPRPADTPRASD